MSHQSPVQLGFTVEHPAAVGGVDPLGLWSASPAPFGVGMPSFQADTVWPLVWRLDVPRQPAAAVLMAQQGLRMGLEADYLLDATAARMEALIVSLRQGTSGEAVPEAEEFHALLSGSVVSFGLEFGAPSWRETEAQLNAFYRLLQDSVSHYAYVETRVEGRLVAWTSVSWGGDIRNYWEPRSTGVYGEMHHGNLATAIRTRSAWLRLGSLFVVRGAQLTALWSNPATLPLALPALWKFVRDFLTRAGDLRTGPRPQSS